MERINWEQWRVIFIGTLSPIAGYFTPTAGFVEALAIMFAFNIWAGMRADNVSIKRCKNFSFSKFKNALAELLLYLVIMEVVFSIMVSCGDAEAAVVVVKSLTYVFMYVYLQNAFRNLVIAYPNRIVLRMIYHVIRMEFARALPSHLRSIVERIDEDLKKDNSDENKQQRTGSDKEI